MKFAFTDEDCINKGQMVQLNNNAWNNRPVPYGVKALQCLKNNKDTSLQIKLVDMLCECSWYVLNILMVLFIMALKQKKVSETSRESIQSHSVLDMSARPVSRVGVLEDWPASRDPKTTGSFGALTENRLECFLQRRCVGYGVKFLLCCYCKLSKFIHRSEYELNYESR